MRSFTKNCFSAHLLYGLTFGNIEYLSHADPFLQVVCLLHFLSKSYRKNYFNQVFNNSEETVKVKYGSMMAEGLSLSIVNPSQTILYSFTEYKLFEQNSKKTEEEKINTEDAVMENTEEAKQISMKQKLNLEELPPLIYEDVSTMKRGLVDNNSKLEIYQSEVVSCPVDLYCLSSSFTAKFIRESHNFHAKRIIFGGERIFPSRSTTPGKLLRDKSTLLPCDGRRDHLNSFP